MHKNRRVFLYSTHVVIHVTGRLTACRQYSQQLQLRVHFAKSTTAAMKDLETNKHLQHLHRIAIYIVYHNNAFI